MKIDVIRKLPEHLDTLILMQEENGTIQNIEYVPTELLHSIDAYMKNEEFNFSFNSVKSFSMIVAKRRVNIILIGAGDKDALTTNKLRSMFASAIRLASSMNARQIYLFPGFISPVNDVAFGHVLAESALLVAYRFDKYLSSGKNKAFPETLHYVLNTKNTRHLNRGILEGRIYAEATNLARELVNEPANVMTPDALAEAAKRAALQYGFLIETIAQDKLRRIKMDAFLSVGRGSVKEPKLIIMRFNGNPDKRQEVIALVGKGLTYDSGGYCIKTPDGMVNMKNDMGGAAAVIGAMCAIASMKLKVNVVAIVAACENMISGDAYRPGDIVTSMSGKTIEVINTDAEGRLTLCDAIHYAIEKEHADRIVDIATLTGAAVAALGNQYSVVLTNNEAWLEQLKSAAAFTGENIWQLPAHDEYKELIKSEIADMKNVGGPLGGAITAGLFLREFVQNKPWLHIDIAGTALRAKESGVNPFGATGVGVRLLTSLLKSME
ncbi:MAG: leucyl aminopeptidase [Candidatus Cloacimonetes bacterium]|nr:leucyl aminopeptidase [Candidatus Cloacimonadota bacterium]